MAKIQDRFVNRAFATVTESAANTLTFAELHTGLAMFEKVAWLIHRLEWEVPLSVWGEFITPSDSLALALVGNNQMSLLDLSDPAVYDRLLVAVVDHGVAASADLFTLPWIRDFSSLPGGGIIVPPRPIFVAAKATGFSAAAVVNVRIFFTHMELKAEEYWELVEATRIIT